MSMGLIAGFWSDFSFISKNLHKSKNKGNFIIVTSKVAIIKWSYFLTYVTLRRKWPNLLSHYLRYCEKRLFFAVFQNGDY